MAKSRLVIFFVFVCLSFLTQESHAISKTFNAQSHTLKNGLKIIVIPNSTLPSLRVAVLYKVGTADDPADMVGLSHFLEHLMFKGSKKFPKGHYNTFVDQIGGSCNAMTGQDFTIYYADIPPNYLDSLLEMEADRMQSLTFNEKEFEAERQVVFEERRMRLENNTFGPISEFLQRALHLYHPYGVPSIGYPQHIERYTIDALRKHHKTWYAPNNAILIVSGNVHLNQVVKMAKNYFGGIASSVIPARKRVMDPRIDGITHRIRQVNPRSSVTRLSYYFHAPGYHGEGQQHYYPLVILSEILGGSDITHFHEYFVNDKKMCITIGANYQDDTLNPKPFSIEAIMAPHVTTESFEKELRQYLENILKNGITAQELEKAKKSIIGELAFMRDGHKGVTTMLLALASDQSLESIESFESSVQKVTKKQIHAAIKFVFSKQPYVCLEVLPSSSKQPNG